MSTRTEPTAVAPARARPGPLPWVLGAFSVAAFVAYDPGGWYPFGPAKGLAVSVLGLGCVALVLARGHVRTVRLVAAAGLGFLAWAGLAAAFGRDGWYAWTGTPERRFGWLTWILCGLLLLAGQSLRRRETAVVAAGVAAAGAVVGVVAAAEALGWHPVDLDADTDRLTATFGSAAYLGAAGALALPVLVGAAADAGVTDRLRWAAGAGAGLLAVTVAGSGTRGAWFGLGVAALVAGWAHRRAVVAHGRTALLGGAAVAVGLAVVMVVSPVGDRVGDAFSDDAGGAQGRLDEWRVAVRVLGRHPVLGVGPEGYRIAFGEGVDAAYERAHGRTPLPDRAHNGLLDIALTTGVPGAVAYVVVVVAVGRFALRALRRGPPWLAGTAAGLIAYAVQQQFLFPVAELDPVAWLVAGAVVAAVARPGELVTVTVPRPVPVAVGAVAAGALTVGALDVVADRRAAAAAEALAAGDAATALDRAERATSLRPDVVRYHLLAARAARQLGEGDAALAHAEDAANASAGDPIVRRTVGELLVGRAGVTHDPADVAAAPAETDRLVTDDPDNAELQLLAGLAAVHAGDTEAAERAWAAAESLAPRSAAPPTNLALLFVQTGRLDEARAAAERAVALDPADARARAALDAVVAAERAAGSA